MFFWVDVVVFNIKFFTLSRPLSTSSHCHLAPSSHYGCSSIELEIDRCTLYECNALTLVGGCYLLMNILTPSIARNMLFSFNVWACFETILMFTCKFSSMGLVSLPWPFL